MLDNSIDGYRRSNFLASNGKRIVQEQKEQIITKEEKLKKEKADQIEYERKIINQDPIPVYLQRTDRPEHISAAQRKEIIKNMESEANKNSDGGFFAKVFQQKDAKDTFKNQQKQAYVDEIQRQIEEKKKKKKMKNQKNWKKIKNMKKNSNRNFKQLMKKQIKRTKKNNQLKQQKINILFNNKMNQR